MEKVRFFIFNVVKNLDGDLISFILSMLILLKSVGINIFFMCLFLVY